jgi:inner membrane protein
MALFQSITFKVFGIAFLALLMLIPLAQVQGLIGERNGMRDQAVATIAQRWGEPQRVGGPLLYIPRRVRVTTDKGIVVRDDGRDVVLPDRLRVQGRLVPEVRHYGIYETPVYTSELKISGEFLDTDLAQLRGADAWLWDQAELRIPVTDVRGIRAVSLLAFAGDQLRLGPSSGAIGRLGAIAVPVGIERKDGGKYAFELTMTLAGTQRLSFLPLARSTEVSLASSWPDPEFDGAFLPTSRKVDAGGFSAQWSVLDFNRGFGQSWREGRENADEVVAAAFGANLYQPANVYQQNDRAGKYGILFVALTFVVFFLFEVLRKLRVHPVQYLLVGLALTTFYVVLLALSEQIGFAFAYLAASAAVVLMIGGYAAAVLNTWRAGVLLGAVLALVYALLYGLVVSEQYSLLMGSIALLAVVGALMYLTRKVDWYAYAAMRPIASGAP